MISSHFHLVSKQNHPKNVWLFDIVLLKWIKYCPLIVIHSASCLPWSQNYWSTYHQYDLHHHTTTTTCISSHITPHMLHFLCSTWNKFLLSLLRLQQYHCSNNAIQWYVKFVWCHVHVVINGVHRKLINYDIWYSYSVCMTK